VAKGFNASHWKGQVLKKTYLLQSKKKVHSCGSLSMVFFIFFLQDTATTYLHINFLWVVRHIAEHRTHSQRRSLPHHVRRWLSIFLLIDNYPWCCSSLTDTDSKGIPLSVDKRLREGCFIRHERLSIYWTRRTWNRWLSKLKWSFDGSINDSSKMTQTALRLITSITATVKYVFCRTYSHQTPQYVPSLCVCVFFFS